MHFWKPIHLLSLIVFVVVFSFCAVQKAHAAVKQQGMDSLPLEARYAVSACIGHDSPAYQVRQDSGALAADNTGQGLSMQFSAAGDNRRGQPALFAAPIAVGLWRRACPAAGRRAAGHGQYGYKQPGQRERVVCERPAGLQQGFTVAEKPQAGSGPLKIAIALDGAKAGSVDADGKGVMLTKADGSPLYRYSGLVVRDAEGRQARHGLKPKQTRWQFAWMTPATPIRSISIRSYRLPS